MLARLAVEPGYHRRIAGQASSGTLALSNLIRDELQAENTRVMEFTRIPILILGRKSYDFRYVFEHVSR